MTIKGGQAATARDEPSVPSRAEGALTLVVGACLVAAALCALGVLLSFGSDSTAGTSYQIAASLVGCLTALVSAAWAFAAAQALAYLRRADERAVAAETPFARPEPVAARQAPAPTPRSEPRSFR